MNHGDVRNGIATRLSSITGLRVYDTVAGQVTPPCALVAIGSGFYDTDFSSGLTVNWSVVLIISRADDPRAQDALDTYLGTASGGLAYAFNADETLGGKVESCRLIGWSDPQSYSIAGVDYVGVEVALEVIGS